MAVTGTGKGIIEPPIDELLTQVESKYALVTYAARRTRQINTYHQQLEHGLFETVGPLVDYQPEDKPLSIALREINAGLLRRVERKEPVAPVAPTMPDFSSIEVPGVTDQVATDFSADFAADFATDFGQDA